MNQVPFFVVFHFELTPSSSCYGFLYSLRADASHEICCMSFCVVYNVVCHLAEGQLSSYPPILFCRRGVEPVHVFRSRSCITAFGPYSVLRCLCYHLVMQCFVPSCVDGLLMPSGIFPTCDVLSWDPRKYSMHWQPWQLSQPVHTGQGPSRTKNGITQ